MTVEVPRQSAREIAVGFLQLGFLLGIGIVAMLLLFQTVTFIIWVSTVFIGSRGPLVLLAFVSIASWVLIYRIVRSS